MNISSPESPSLGDIYLSSNLEQDQLISGRIMKVLRFIHANASKLAILTSLTLINEESPLSTFKTHQICANISQFKNLKTLILENKGQIDTQEVILLCTAISKLTNLQTLTFNLWGYSIENYGASRVSIFLDNLVNLQSLTLSLRSYTKQDNILQPLSSSLVHCQQLKYFFFELDYAFFTETEAEHLRNGITALVNLTNLSLILKGNTIDVSHVKVLSSSVDNCLHLESLTFNFNRMKTSEDNHKSLCFELRNLPQLKDFKLFLGESNLRCDDIVCVSEAISKLKNLVNLNINLRKSNIEENAAKCIGSFISNLISLSSLFINLDNCSLQLYSMQHLLLAIQNLTNLTSLTLNLFWDEIETPTSENLSSCISQLKNLQTLSLSISGEFISQKNMKELSDNQFYYKKLRKNKLQSIFSAIATLERLQSLDLRLQNFYNEGNIGIAAWLKELPYLQHFSLKFLSCYLEFDDISDISLGISKLVNLQSLQIESYFQREIAKSWYDLVFNEIRKLRDLKVLFFEYQISQQTKNKIYAKNSRLVTLRRKPYK